MYKFFGIMALVVIVLTCGCGSSARITGKGYRQQSVVLQHIGKRTIALNPMTFMNPQVQYIVKGNYSLGGKTVKVGSRCSIILDGGSLRDGIIVGDDTFIEVKQENRPFRDISFTGTFLMPIIKSDYFEINETTLTDIFSLSSSRIKNDIYINDNLSATIPSEWNGAVITKSLSDIYLNADIKLNTCSFKGGNVFYVRDCHDVNISGSGQIIGDLLTHRGDEGESIYGIFIRNAKSINISGITCKLFWGDGIYIYPGVVTDGFIPVCRNIVIDYVTCDSNRRQGISIVGGENIVIKNSRLLNTGSIKGTAPSSGIDIEPAKGLSVDNIVIDNCEFVNNGANAKYPSDLQVVNNYGSVKVKKCRLNNFFYGRADNIAFEDCIIKGKFYTSSTGIGKNVRLINSQVKTIQKNLIKKENVNIVNTSIED